MESVVDEDGECDESGDAWDGTFAFPPGNWIKRLETLDGAAVIKHPWEYPKTSSEYSHQQIHHKSQYNQRT